MERERDLIVIGGGPGGMGAARAAARAGLRPLLVQFGGIGGDCTFTGCVPSKTLIEAAARGESFAAAIAATRRAVGIIAAREDDDIFRREGIDVLHGRATFRSTHEIDVDGIILRSRRFVLATGAVPGGPVPPTAGIAATSTAGATGPSGSARSPRPGRAACPGRRAPGTAGRPPSACGPDSELRWRRPGRPRRGQ